MNNFMRTCAVVLSLVILSACGSTKEIVDKPVLYTKPTFVVPDPGTVSLETWDWSVVSAEQFCVSPEGYTAMQTNEKALRDYIRKLKDVILAYKSYYGTPQDQKALSSKTP